MIKSNDDHRKITKKLYNERSDLEKLQSQWNKLSGLHLRDEPSAAIVRCATAAEIAVNYAIRHEWSRQTEFAPEIVNQFLMWANGLKGKVDRLFVPIYFAYPDKSKIAKSLKASAEKINKIRNAVVHQGVFCDAHDAEKTIAEAKKFIDAIIGLSIPGFCIKDRARSK